MSINILIYEIFGFGTDITALRDTRLPDLDFSTRNIHFSTLRKMAQDYTEWLAVNVLNEQQNVNIPNHIPFDRANAFEGQLPQLEQSAEGPLQCGQAVREQRSLLRQELKLN